MRIDTEHDFHERVNNPETIKLHLVAEVKLRRLINGLVDKQGTITGMYWLIDFIAAINPDEFSKERKALLKQTVLKVYTAYDTQLSNKALASMLHAAGYKAADIATLLGVARNSVYYYLKRNDYVPTRCVLSYGEYNLVMDFLDAMTEIAQLTTLDKIKTTELG